MARQQRYAALDGLRGVAAILVVGHHLENSIGAHAHFSRGYLAVDFFFALSGFVMASAYEERLARGMAFREFAKTRLIRIYPLIFLGALVGAAVAMSLNPGRQIGLALASQVLLIPALSASPYLFPLNTAHWSIVLELVANSLHALGLRWLGARLLAIWLVVAAAALAALSWQVGGLGGGWGTSNWLTGLARVAFSYPLGVFVFRLWKGGQVPAAPPIPFPLIAAALVAVTLGSVKAHPHWLGDVAVTLVAVPLIIWLGLSCKMDATTAAAAGQLGAMSYPLYAIHEPLTRLWAAYAPPTGLSGTLALMGFIALAVAADRYYDRPARGWLSLLLGRARGQGALV